MIDNAAPPGRVFVTLKLIGALGSRDSGGVFVLGSGHLRLDVLEQLIVQEVYQSV